MVVSDVPEGCSLILEGEPGVGKSTLFDYGVAAARREGRRVLVARPTPVEYQQFDPFKFLIYAELAEAEIGPVE